MRVKSRVPTPNAPLPCHFNSPSLFIPPLSSTSPLHKSYNYLSIFGASALTFNRMAEKSLFARAGIAIKAALLYVRSIFKSRSRTSKPVDSSSQELTTLVLPRRAILRLPLELEREIASYLSPSSRACLALTCRKFYYDLSDVLSDATLIFPPPRSHLRPGQGHTERAKLLVRLESPGSTGWKYCQKCLKLHPRGEFEDGDSPNSMICRWPGVIILCRCIRFSPRRIAKISGQLQSTPDINIMGTTIKKHISEWHFCPWSAQGMPGVAESDPWRLLISPSLDEDNRVVFHFTYSIQVRQSNSLASQKLMLDIYPCACVGFFSWKRVRALSFSCKACGNQRLSVASRCGACAFVARLSILGCWHCFLNPDVQVWQEDGFTRCLIGFTMAHNVPNLDIPSPVAKKR